MKQEGVGRFAFVMNCLPQILRRRMKCRDKMTYDSLCGIANNNNSRRAKHIKAEVPAIKSEFYQVPTFQIMK